MNRLPTQKKGNDTTHGTLEHVPSAHETPMCGKGG